MNQEQRNRYKCYIEIALANGRVFNDKLIEDALKFAKQKIE